MFRKQNSHHIYRETRCVQSPDVSKCNFVQELPSFPGNRKRGTHLTNNVCRVMSNGSTRKNGGFDIDQEKRPHVLSVARHEMVPKLAT
jgi:hypothetical protein